MGQVTKLLQQATEGDQRALDVVLPIIEKELHARAVQMMRAERRDHTLQPTALVHEAYLRLVDKKAIDYADRAHFLAVASKKMREVLRNHARDRRARKRGGDRDRVPFSESILLHSDRLADVVGLDEAFSRIEERNSRWAKLIELKLLGGLEAREIGELLQLSQRTVERDLKVATLFLLRELDEGDT